VEVGRRVAKGDEPASYLVASIAVSALEVFLFHFPQVTCAMRPQHYEHGYTCDQNDCYQQHMCVALKRVFH
jgi:hypothetical protein